MGESTISAQHAANSAPQPTVPQHHSAEQAHAGGEQEELPRIRALQEVGGEIRGVDVVQPERLPLGDVRTSERHHDAPERERESDRRGRRCREKFHTRPRPRPHLARGAMTTIQPPDGERNERDE